MAKARSSPKVPAAKRKASGGYIGGDIVPPAERRRRTKESLRKQADKYRTQSFIDTMLDPIVKREEARIRRKRAKATKREQKIKDV